MQPSNKVARRAVRRLRTAHEEAVRVVMARDRYLHKAEIEQLPLDELEELIAHTMTPDETGLRRLWFLRDDEPIGGVILA